MLVWSGVFLFTWLFAGLQDRHVERPWKRMLEMELDLGWSGTVWAEL